MLCRKRDIHNLSKNTAESRDLFMLSFRWFQWQGFVITLHRPRMIYYVVSPTRRFHANLCPVGPSASHVAERKSGTGFTYEWATTALAHACVYLARAYGEGSCWIEWDFKNRTLIFDPAEAVPGAAVCPCEDFERYRSAWQLTVYSPGS